jgi:hypothetical protein
MRGNEMTPNDIAKILGVSKRTAMKLIDGRLLKSRKDPHNGRRYVGRADMAEFIRAHRDLDALLPVAEELEKQDSRR